MVARALEVVQRLCVATSREGQAAQTTGDLGLRNGSASCSGMGHGALVVQVSLMWALLNGHEVGQAMFSTGNHCGVGGSQRQLKRLVVVLLGKLIRTTP